MTTDLSTEVLPHVAGCPASGGDTPIEECLLCLHDRELATLTHQDVLEAIHELESRYGDGRAPYQMGMDATVADLLAYLTNLRRLLNVGPVRHNRVKCLHCDDVIESKNRHDYVSCKCGSTSADGGTWYCRRSFKPIGEGLGFEGMGSSWPGTYIEELRNKLHFAREYGPSEDIEVAPEDVVVDD